MLGICNQNKIYFASFISLGNHLTYWALLFREYTYWWNWLPTPEKFKFTKKKFVQFGVNHPWSEVSRKFFCSPNTFLGNCYLWTDIVIVFPFTCPWRMHGIKFTFSQLCLSRNYFSRGVDSGQSRVLKDIVELKN